MSQNINYYKLGKRLNAARIKKDLTLKQLATLLGIEPGSLANVESGNAAPSTELLFSIAQILDIPVDYFLADSLNNLGSAIDYMIHDLFVTTPSPQKERLIAISKALMDTLSAENQSTPE